VDATAILDCFEPLAAWLAEQNEGVDPAGEDADKQQPSFGIRPVDVELARIFNDQSSFRVPLGQRFSLIPPEPHPIPWGAD
jgi:hypothetical protein